MKYLPLPIALLEVGKPLPVDVLSDTGTLLLRRGQPIVSEQHRNKLYEFKACTLLSEGQAWQRAYERTVHEMLMQGADLAQVAAVSMPSEIRDVDYARAVVMEGDWLDLQQGLRGVLYQGGLAIQPLGRLQGMQERLQSLLRQDADDGLYALFQALADHRLGYCATHALLCAVLCELTATRINLPGALRQPLVAAALTMNIGMAREQDQLARQSEPINGWQRTLVSEHAARGEEILRQLGVVDPLQLDLVRWHHMPQAEQALPQARSARELLHLADVFIARVAARATRPAQPPVAAVKSMVFGGVGDLGQGSAMAQAVGFYPPGSYVRLANGEVAVVVQRGERANTPWVIGVLGADSLASANYHCKSTAEPRYAITAPVNFETVKVTLNADRVRKARERIPRS